MEAAMTLKVLVRDSLRQAAALLRAAL